MFKKGQQVAVIRSWNNKGMVRIIRATVHSCGKKVLRLQDREGNTFKAAYDPSRNEMTSFNGMHIINDTDNATIEAVALADAAKVIELNIARIDSTVAHYSSRNDIGPAYFASMAKQRAELEAAKPEFHWAERI